MLVDHLAQELDDVLERHRSLDELGPVDEIEQRAVHEDERVERVGDLLHRLVQKEDHLPQAGVVRIQTVAQGDRPQGVLRNYRIKTC